MKQTKYYFLITILFLISCKKDTVIDREIKSIPINIVEFQKIDTTFQSGKIVGLKLTRTNKDYTKIEFYGSGKKKSIHRIFDGQCHGDYFDWFENGKIKWKRSYINGNIIGYNNEYDEKGRLILSSTEKPVSWKIYTYHKNNKLKCRQTNNSFTEFYSNGEIKCNYNIKGNSQFVQYYNQNGTLVFNGKYDSKTHIISNKFGAFTGKILTTFSDGTISNDEEFLNGRANNSQRTYYPDRHLKFIGSYKNGNRIGIHKHFYENGRIRNFNDYDNNIHKRWTETGELEK